MIFLSGSFIFTRIYNALAEREGKRVTLPTLVTVTSLTEKQIQGSIANARRVHELYADQIEVVETGRVWKLKRIAKEDKYATPEEIVEEVQVGSTHIWKRVLAALVANEGRISSKELLAERASTPDHPITPHQAANAMMTILRRPGTGERIETKVSGHAWKYHAPTQSTNVTAPKAEGTSVSAPIRGSVLRYFAKHPGEILFRDDIAEDLGFTVKQVQSAMYSLLNENQATRDDFEVVQASYAWRYVPNRTVAPAESNGQVTPALEQAPAQEFKPTPSAPVATVTLPLKRTDGTSVVVPAVTPAQTATTNRLFEEIGQAGNGDILVQESETKKIYRAIEL